MSSSWHFWKKCRAVEIRADGFRADDPLSGFVYKYATLKFIIQFSMTRPTIAEWWEILYLCRVTANEDWLTVFIWVRKRLQLFAWNWVGGVSQSTLLSSFNLAPSVPLSFFLSVPLSLYFLLTSIIIMPGAVNSFKLLCRSNDNNNYFDFDALLQL